ncbi:MAG TPA: anhydro-N-acetylmuramic acid kinase [Burkholderiales bacterium]|nr:anhydro-N-acetylmuramic acid kinase [Burkholderiales bacterium]
MSGSLQRRPSELYIGLMSGTSLDGVDAALVDLRSRPVLLGTEFLPYPKALKAVLFDLQAPSRDELHRASLAGIRLSGLYATAASRLLRKCRIPPGLVRAIGCHGQTVRHRPQSGYTVQLGSPAVLADRLGIPVVADFRSADIAAGGQGAPLVPAFHAAVFRSERVHRVVVNLGGIANLTSLPPRGKVKGFDTGPGNVLLDAWIAWRLGKDFDRGGRFASRGRPLQPLLGDLLADPYFHRSPPKSTGRDHFNLAWLRRFGVARHKAEDVQATLAELSARSIASAIARFCSGASEVYLCGGGARNSDLVRRIARALPDVPVASTLQLGIHPDWVEAMAFAWLAQRRVKGETANLPEVTGARNARVLGSICAA